jgi:hypothetical protein
MSIPVCPSEFIKEDSRTPEYSCTEADVYQWIPFDMQSKQLPNHRLSIRKNLKTEKFELYRRIFYFNSKNNYDVVIKTSDTLPPLLNQANIEWNTYHCRDGQKPEIIFVLCDHKRKKATFCKIDGWAEEYKGRVKNGEFAES